MSEETTDEMKDVIVVGAGLSGLGAARALVEAGLDVLVLDKGRGVGGRCATRRLAVEGHEIRIDHGAPCFTIRDAAFRAAMTPLLESGELRSWVDGLVTCRAGSFEAPPAAHVEPRYAHLDGNAAIARFLAGGLDIRCETAVTGLERAGGGWHVSAEDLGRGRILPFRARQVLVSCPLPQAARLVEADVKVPEVGYDVVWAVMAVFAPGDARARVPDALRFEDEPVLDRAYRDSSKRDGASHETWVLHARADWSREHAEEPREAIGAALLAAAGRATGASFGGAIAVQAHRWRFARPVETLEGGFVAADGLYLAGDAWGERIEGAWLSGVRMARELVSAPVG
jgi:predicted NAD/FAD-dependent oxidoreductase